jgi:PRTRC genetic system protein C
MERIIKYKGNTLPDPGPDFTPEQVRDLYAGQFPELNNARIQVHEEGGISTVEFVVQVGTKG